MFNVINIEWQLIVNMLRRVLNRQSSHCVQRLASQNFCLSFFPAAESNTAPCPRTYGTVIDIFFRTSTQDSLSERYFYLIPRISDSLLSHCREWWFATHTLLNLHHLPILFNESWFSAMGTFYGRFLTFQSDFCGYCPFGDLIFNFDCLVLFLLFA